MFGLSLMSHDEPVSSNVFLFRSESCGFLIPLICLGLNFRMKTHYTRQWNRTTWNGAWTPSRDDVPFHTMQVSS